MPNYLAIVPSERKTCTKCGEEKPLSEFRINKQGRLGRHSRCRACEAQYQREKYKRNPERHAAYIKAWQERHPERAAAIKRRCELRRNYGLTPEDYDSLLHQQQGGCAICGQAPNGRALNVDHDHVTGRVRGLLCDDCNQAIGKLKDDPQLLLRAAKYLREAQCHI